MGMKYVVLATSRISSIKESHYCARELLWSEHWPDSSKWFIKSSITELSSYTAVLFQSALELRLESMDGDPRTLSTGISSLPSPVRDERYSDPGNIMFAQYLQRDSVELCRVLQHRPGSVPTSFLYPKGPNPRTYLQLHSRSSRSPIGSRHSARSRSAVPAKVIAVSLSPPPVPPATAPPQIRNRPVRSATSRRIQIPNSCSPRVSRSKHASRVGNNSFCRPLPVSYNGFLVETAVKCIEPVFFHATVATSVHFKFQNFKFPVQMCRLVKLKLLGRVGTFHNSPGQPPEVFYFLSPSSQNIVHFLLLSSLISPNWFELVSYNSMVSPRI
eukprot:sb/3466683/